MPAIFMSARADSGVIREDVADALASPDRKGLDSLIPEKRRDHRPRGRLTAAEEPSDLVLVGGHLKRIPHQTVVERVLVVLKA